MAFLLKNLRGFPWFPRYRTWDPDDTHTFYPEGHPQPPGLGPGEGAAQFPSVFCLQRPERWLKLEFLQLSSEASESNTLILAFSSVVSPLPWPSDDIVLNFILSGNMKLVIFKTALSWTNNNFCIYVHVYLMYLQINVLLIKTKIYPPNIFKMVNFYTPGRELLKCGPVPGLV